MDCRYYQILSRTITCISPSCFLQRWDEFYDIENLFIMDIVRKNLFKHGLFCEYYSMKRPQFGYSMVPPFWESDYSGWECMDDEAWDEENIDYSHGGSFAASRQGAVGGVRHVGTWQCQLRAERDRAAGQLPSGEGGDNAHRTAAWDARRDWFPVSWRMGII